mgnify:CR=1 FL=1|tara:strand:+ start:5227 stop:5691 length:465 start_codon:yes stop_codon:yes gene_type:complete
MSRSYPIWNRITACIYNSPKSYGVKEIGDTEILVGSSGSNSHTLGKVRTRKLNISPWLVAFRLSVDGVLVKEMVFNTQDDTVTAKDRIYTASYIDGLSVCWSVDSKVLQNYEGIYNMMSVGEVDILNSILVIPKNVLEAHSINVLYERENTLKS